MLFDIPYFDRLPKGYCAAVVKLNNDLEAGSTNTVKQKVLSKFAETYTTITPIWEYWKNNVWIYPGFDEDLIERQSYHFYSFSLLSKNAFKRNYRSSKQKSIQRRFSNKKEIYSKIFKAKKLKNYRNMDEYKEFIQYSEEALKYPSEYLNYIYLHYCIKSGSFVSDKIKSRYQQSLKWMDELKMAENDDEKWMKCLLKVDNEDYIITNFEFRLEAFPWNRKLWEFYINYLKKINSKSILNVYLRYCRFFIDDIIAKEKYRNEIERIVKDLKMNVTKWWIDIIRMESNIDKAHKILEEILSSKTPKSKKLLKFAQKFLKEKKMEKFTNLIQSAKRYIIKNTDCETSKDDVLSNPAFENEILTFNFDGNVFFSIPTIDSTVQPSITTVGNFNTYTFQQFSFPKTICNYIFDNPNYIHRQKLFLTCKYFVVRYQTPICCNIVIKSSPNPFFYEQSIEIPESSITTVKNFYVGNSLDAWITENPLTVSNLCSIVFQFDLKYLKLHTQKLTQKEFEFLTAPGNIESVYLVSVSIIDLNGKEANFEDIVKRFPKASRIRLFTSTEYSNETAQNLLTQKRNTKIKHFEFCSFALNAESFCQFIQKNMAPNSEILVMYENAEPEYLQIFKSAIENMLKIWEPQNEKPLIDVIVGEE